MIRGSENDKRQKTMFPSRKILYILLTAFIKNFKEGAINLSCTWIKSTFM